MTTQVERAPGVARSAPVASSRPPLAAVVVISAAALGFEILLMRAFSVTQWYHFAYLVISLALLGFGASGTFLSIAGARLGARFHEAFAVNGLLFGVSALGSFALGQQVPFNPLALVWDSAQPGWLLVQSLLLMVPFFFAANCIGLALARFRDCPGRVYAADLVGAGLGALGAVALAVILPVAGAVAASAAGGPLAAALALEGRRGRRPRLILAGLALLALWAGSTALIPLNPSPYKPLSQALRVTGARIGAVAHGPLGQITVVENTVIPLRHVPGRSLSDTSPVPAQAAMFVDGDGPAAITRFDGDPAPLVFSTRQTSALPYQVVRRPRVLVLGAGGGAGVLQALAHDAVAVDAVELNRQVVDLVRGPYGPFAGGIYAGDGRVRAHVAEARSFLAATTDRYDVIQIEMVDAFNAAAAGLHGLGESHLYTVEALADYLAHLAPGGVVAVTRWLKLPPRDGVKLFATAVRALRAGGVRDPGRHLAWIRGWNTGTVLIARDPLRRDQTDAIGAFCDEGGFDTVHLPGRGPGEVRNALAHPWFRDAAQALLGPDGAGFVERYKFDVRPATDDRPYFFNFFRWRTLPEILALREHGGAALLDMGYLVLVVALLQALLVSTVLILLPLWLHGRVRAPPGARRAVLGYYGAIGLAFLFLEIAFIQKFVLFLGHPLYAVTVVLCAFLVFAGLGSHLSSRLAERGRAGRVSLLPVAGITVLGTVYVAGVDPLFAALLSTAVPVKIAVCVALVAPLALCMGMPFPLGLGRLAKAAPGLIPWAWGINGCASVVSAILATLIAIEVGNTVVVILALSIYLAGWWAGRFPPPAIEPGTA